MAALFKPNVDKLLAKNDVEGLIEALEYTNDELVRVDAAETLTEIGDVRAVKPLIMALNDGNDDVVAFSAQALGKIGDKRAVEPLIEIFDIARGGVRDWIIVAFGQIGDDRAVDLLIETLENKNSYPLSRCWAAGALGKIANKKAVTPLITALEDDFEDLRRDAAKALGEIGDKRAVTPLIKALKDNEYYVRARVGKALKKIGDEKAVEPLIKAVDVLIKALESSDEFVRSEATEALGEIGDERAIDPLIKVLDDVEGEVRANGALALVKIGNDNKKTVEPLIKIIELTIEALKSSNWDVHVDAAEALKKIGDERVVKPLKIALNDEDEYVREAAKEAIENIQKGEGK